MIYNYPFFNFTPFRKNPAFLSKVQMQEPAEISYNIKKNPPEKSKEFLNNFQDEVKNYSKEDNLKNEGCFDLFGLKLYNDDILLLCLIFFLYKEDVKDEYLFIALILLLLS